MIDPQDVRDALTQQQKSTCTHPTEHIRDLPSGSVCKKCGESVPPLMRDKMTITIEEFVERFVVPNYERTKETIDPPYETTMDWMGRIPTRMGVFPSSGEE